MGMYSLTGIDWLRTPMEILVLVMHLQSTKVAFQKIKNFENRIPEKSLAQFDRHKKKRHWHSL